MSVFFIYLNRILNEYINNFITKKYHKAHHKIIEERGKQTDEVKKTRYADSSYKYVPMKPVHSQETFGIWDRGN